MNEYCWLKIVNIYLVSFNINKISLKLNLMSRKIMETS